MSKLLLAFVLAIGASNSPAGFVTRATIAVPLLWVHAVSEQTARSFVLDAHCIELPAPFGWHR